MSCEKDIKKGIKAEITSEGVKPSTTEDNPSENLSISLENMHLITKWLNTHYACCVTDRDTNRRCIAIWPENGNVYCASRVCPTKRDNEFVGFWLDTPPTRLLRVCTRHDNSVPEKVREALNQFIEENNLIAQKT